MKIGLGFCREQLHGGNFRFAVQAGATHVVAHITNHFMGRDSKICSGDPHHGWCDGSADRLWSHDELANRVAAPGAAGLELAALKNFPPRFWYDVLFAGLELAQQIEGLKHSSDMISGSPAVTAGHAAPVRGAWRNQCLRYRRCGTRRADP